MTREDYEAHKEDYKDNNVSPRAFVLIQDVYIRILEAQLKAKESDLERQDMIIKCLSMDLDSKEKLLKAKDEEIKVLECRAYHAEGYISDLHNNPKDKKFYDKKARSIVAMLFWEWRKADRIIESNAKTRESTSLIARVDERRIAFENAYMMLKDK